MKRMMILVIVVFGLMVSHSWSGENIQQSVIDWKLLSDNLVHAIKTPNEGLQISAMQLIIRYTPYLNVKEAKSNLEEIFWTSEDPRLRILAIVTLYSVDTSLTVFLINRRRNFEKNKKVLALCQLILKAHYLRQSDRMSSERIQVLTRVE